ncbi:Uma2 family endonuclease [Chamaesiphon sp.]|uniref:Uma2 family endonuclease n=1 Tax=Chamaesiphon sp. TaxID=2814140 RepID=UPI003593A7FB
MVNTQIRQLTSTEYYQMMESGIIREGERVELVLGQIFTMAAKGTRHTLSTRKLFKQLLALIGDRADVQSQDPITLPNNSEPEPDIVIARLRSDDYVNSHPSPADIILVIEVADSSIKFDRETKAPLYAAAGISEYWIINLIDDRLEIYRQPEGDIYTSIEIVTPPRSVSLPQFPEISLNISDFFPASKT